MRIAVAERDQLEKAIGRVYLAEPLHIDEMVSDASTQEPQGVVLDIREGSAIWHPRSGS